MMPRVIVAAALCALVLCLVSPATCSWVGYTTAAPESYDLVAKHNASALYNLVAPASAGTNFGYDSPVQLVVLEGSHYQMGYDYGVLLGKQVVAMADLFLHNLISPVKVVQDAVREFCVWQYDSYLSKHTPDIYTTELQGMAAANAAAARDVKLVITLANFPGSIGDLRYVLEKELFGKAGPGAVDVFGELDKLLVDGGMDAERAGKIFAGLGALVDAEFENFQCSMMGVWGDRTQDGNVYSFRNLDWSAHTGANTAKLITVYKPDDGYAYAGAAYAGFYGVLAGVSEHGISTHEANLEEGAEISFNGMAWVLRLRYIMEKAANLDEALAMWNSEHNTVGFNFGIMSQPDKAGVVIETNDEVSVVFHADSPQEAEQMIESDGKMVQYGFPLPDAVYRTNNAFGNETRKYYSWSQSINSNSEKRYLLIHQGLLDYEAAGVAMGLDETLNITAILGQKGKQEPEGNVYHCPAPGAPTPEGSNTISMANDLSTLVSNVAWGKGLTAADWRAACCNTYVTIDFTKWF